MAIQFVPIHLRVAELSNHFVTQFSMGFADLWVTIWKDFSFISIAKRKKCVAFNNLLDSIIWSSICMNWLFGSKANCGEIDDVSEDKAMKYPAVKQTAPNKTNITTELISFTRLLGLGSELIITTKKIQLISDVKIGFSWSKIIINKHHHRHISVWSGTGLLTVRVEL